MNEKSKNILEYHIVKKQSISVHVISHFNESLVAGIIGIASAVKNDHPFINSIIPGKLVIRPSCADPTPGQELLLSAGYRKHYLPKWKASYLPATTIYQKIELPYELRFIQKMPIVIKVHAN